MTYILSRRSLDNLNGVAAPLVEVVKLAITTTENDFGVIEGVRTKERQESLVATGASKTLYSKHLTGDAVDLLAYVKSRASWDIKDYFAVADAMQAASKVLDVPLRWGGAWHVQDISRSFFSAKDLYDDYVDYCASHGRRPFVDGVHFEIYPRQ